MVKYQVLGALKDATQELSFINKMPISIQYHCVSFSIEIVDMCELQRGNWRKGEPIILVDSSKVCLNILTRGSYLALSACSRPDGNPSVYMLKALHPVCIIIAFSSRQVFKPHLKPYTGRTVQR